MKAQDHARVALSALKGPILETELAFKEEVSPRMAVKATEKCPTLFAIPCRMFCPIKAERTVKQMMIKPEMKKFSEVAEEVARMVNTTVAVLMTRPAVKAVEAPLGIQAEVESLVQVPVLVRDHEKTVMICPMEETWVADRVAVNYFMTGV